MQPRACRLGLAILLVVLVALAAACGQPAAPPTTPAPAPPAEPSKHGGSVFFHIPGEVTSLSHIHIADTVSGAVHTWTRERLFQRHPVTGDWDPQLATGWHSSQDGLVWTFDLRQGVKWHDGHPFTAADVVFTAELIQNEETASIWRNNLHIGGKPIKFEAVGDYQVRVTLSEPFAPLFANLMCLAPQPKHILENIPPKDVAKSQFAHSPILTGPFKFAEYKPGEYIRLVRFEDYWDGAPYLDEVILRIIPDANAALIALETGQIDFISTTNPADFVRAKELGTLETVQFPGGNTQMLCLNNEVWPFTELNVRKAISHLVDRETICNHVMRGLARPAWCPMTPTYLFFNEDAQVKYEFSIDKAKALLADAGFTPGSDGILQKDGKKLEFEMWYRSGSDVDEQALLIIQSAMEKAGIKMMIRSYEWSVMVKAVTEQVSPLKFEAMRMGHSMGPDPDLLSLIYDITVPGAYVRMQSPVIHELFAKGRVEMDPDKRRVIYEDLQRAWGEEAGSAWLYHRDGLYIFGRRLGVDEAIVSPYAFFRYPGKLYVKQ